MNKLKSILFVITFLLIINLLSGISLATPPTLSFSKNSQLFFMVTSIENNKINCKFIYNYDTNNQDESKMIFKEDCCIEISNNTIFVDGISKEVIKNEGTIQNIKENMIISAFLNEEFYDVESTELQGTANYIVYNITDNIVIDNFTSPRYDREKGEFSFYNYNLNKTRFTVDAQNVYDENGNNFDVDSIVLWKDIDDIKDRNLGENANNMDGNYLGIYWFDNNRQIEKAFLIEFPEETNDKEVIEKDENNNYRIFMTLSIIFIILISLYTILKNKNSKTNNL